MDRRIERFLQEWVSGNVHNIPGLDDPAPEVARLRIQLTIDARAVGFDANDLETEVGDLDDYLTAEYENVHDPELGFR